MIIAPKYGWICNGCRQFKEAEDSITSITSPVLPNGWLVWNLFDEVKTFCSLQCATGRSATTYTINSQEYLPRYHKFEKHDKPEKE